MTTVPTPSRTAKAIETRYAGHRFRSRLEARWAVFFDALGGVDGTEVFLREGAARVGAEVGVAHALPVELI